ncbi:MAG: TetR/AcrR family transcriptional regulator [Anaerolineales bacterium]|nr:TetR/AcrR family transcriptional regulator [Anaerolineales bacterium]
MSKNSIRTSPKQPRGQQRVDLILNTAAVLFAEIGYENATTNAVAERAGISIGSLYRYFPDKDAILQALAERYRAEILALYDQVFTADVIYLPLPVLLDRLIDPFLEKYLLCPIYAHILLGADVSPEIAAASRELEQESIRRTAELFLRVAPNLGEQRARLSATVVKAIIKSLVSLLAASNDPEYRRQIIIEFKRVLLAYAESTIQQV